jgi:DNA-binding response OmpR family regulator
LAEQIADLRDKRILLIEDDPHAQTFVRTTTRLERAHLRLAQTVEEGMAILEKEGPFDLVLLDLNLPTLPGWEALTMINERQAEVPVAIFSVEEDPAARERARRLGAVAFIQKPVGAREFVSTLKRLLS